MLAEIFCLQVEAEVRASPFCDRAIRDPRFVRVHLSALIASGSDQAPVESLVQLSKREAAN